MKDYREGRLSKALRRKNQWSMTAGERRAQGGEEEEIWELIKSQPVYFGKQKTMFYELRP